MPAPYDFYDYPLYWKNRQYEDLAERVALRKIFSIVGKKRILGDIGGGFGRLVPLYLPFAEKIYLCDSSEKLLSLAKEKLADFKKIFFKKDFLPKLSFSDSFFDVVVMVRVIHHFRDSKKIIKELDRVLKPGGFLILEFANKNHFLAIIRAILKKDFLFWQNLSPLDLRSEESITKRKIGFFNHHPQKILKDLNEIGFEVIKIYSVSNFRSPIIKKIVPLKILLILEKIGQKLFSRFYFGPSIFILAKKPIILDKKKIL